MLRFAEELLVLTTDAGLGHHTCLGQLFAEVQMAITQRCNVLSMHRMLPC